MEAVDIDKAFDDLVLLDQIESEKGYKDGYTAGAREAEATGRGLGFHRAAQVASEIGFYDGFVQQLELSLNASPSDTATSDSRTSDSPSPSSDRAARQVRRARPLLLSLRRLIAQLPRHNAADRDVTALLDTIRAKFRQLCAVLKVNPTSGTQQKEISF